MIYVDQHCHWTDDRCHLVADSPEELRAAAWAIELAGHATRLQYEGTRDEHYDVTLGERANLLAQTRMRVTELSNERMYALVKGRTDDEYLRRKLASWQTKRR